MERYEISFPRAEGMIAQEKLAHRVMAGGRKVPQDAYRKGLVAVTVARYIVLGDMAEHPVVHKIMALLDYHSNVTGWKLGALLAAEHLLHCSPHKQTHSRMQVETAESSRPPYRQAFYFRDLEE